MVVKAVSDGVVRGRRASPLADLGEFPLVIDVTGLVYICDIQGELL